MRHKHLEWGFRPNYEFARQGLRLDFSQGSKHNPERSWLHAECSRLKTWRTRTGLRYTEMTNSEAKLDMDLGTRIYPSLFEFQYES
eukprot:759261-Hanusia_phi.AAC.2